MFHEDAQDVLLIGVEQELVVVILGGVREEDKRTHQVRLEPLAHREAGQRLLEVHLQLHEGHVGSQREHKGFPFKVWEEINRGTMTGPVSL